MKGLATIQIDIDSFESILGGYDYRTNKSLGYKTIYQIAIPRFLELFDRYSIKATFFVIGRDTLVSENREMIQEILKRGHEIANHSMHHFTKPSFSSLSCTKKSEEIDRAEETIFEVTSVKPVGFKAPAYSIMDGTLFDILEDRGYLYDSSVCPVFCVPAVKFIQYLLTGERREKGHWGAGKNMFAPLAPYHPSQNKVWKKGDRKFTEVPVSTIPLFRIPFHASIVYTLGLSIFRLGYGLTKLTRKFLNYQFHAFELIDSQEVNPQLLSLRPGATKSLMDKKQLIDTILARVVKDYQILTTKNLVQQEIR